MGCREHRRARQPGFDNVFQQFWAIIDTSQDRISLRRLEVENVSGLALLGLINRSVPADQLYLKYFDTHFASYKDGGFTCDARELLDSLPVGVYAASEDFAHGRVRCPAVLERIDARIAEHNVALHKVPGYSAVYISLKTEDTPPGDCSDTQMDAIARTLGPYKISVHSGSDKYSVYPIIGRVCGDLMHVKTAGTWYLEAIT